MAARNNSQDHSNMNNLYKPKNSPAPAPAPTALSQLKNTRGTMMAIPESVTAGSKGDPNTYQGTYKGKDYTFKSGKATRNK